MKRSSFVTIAFYILCAVFAKLRIRWMCIFLAVLAGISIFPRLFIVGVKILLESSNIGARMIYFANTFGLGEILMTVLYSIKAHKLKKINY